MRRKILNSKEVKAFLSALSEQYGAFPDVFKKAAFAGGKEKVYLLSRGADNIDMSQLRINSLGLYVSEFKNGQVRLSIEGAQLVGPAALKNLHEISDEQVKDWLEGKDLQVEGDYDGFVILKNKGDFFGSGKYRDGVIFNYVPKARRVLDLHQECSR